MIGIKLLTARDEYPEGTGLCLRGSQVPGQVVSGTGAGRRSLGRHLQYRHILSVIVFFLWFTMLIPLTSCELEASYNEVKAGELKKLIDDGAAVMIVDNRSEYEYNRAHLPKAVNIPQERLFSLDSLLPKDKAFRVVFYCAGYG